MTTHISSATKQQVTELILSVDGGKLTLDEVEIFNRYVFMSSMLWAGRFDGHLICLWGLVPPTLLSEQAYLWLYTTEAAKQHEFILVRRSQIELAKMLERYPKIVGHCKVGADRSIRWLKWLGAQFGEPDGLLIPFVIRGKNG